MDIPLLLILLTRVYLHFLLFCGLDNTVCCMTISMHSSAGFQRWIQWRYRFTFHRKVKNVGWGWKEKKITWELVFLLLFSAASQSRESMLGRLSSRTENKANFLFKGVDHGFGDSFCRTV